MVKQRLIFIKGRLDRSTKNWRFVSYNIVDARSVSVASVRPIRTQFDLVVWVTTLFLTEFTQLDERLSELEQLRDEPSEIILRRKDT